MRKRETVRLKPELLSRLLIEQALLRGELAAAAGVSSSRISAAMSGHTVGLKSARAIARALRKRLVDLIDDGPAAEPRPARPAEPAGV